MNDKVILYGIGGHARSVASLLEVNEIEIVGYCHPDGSADEQILGRIPYLGSELEPTSSFKTVLALGNNLERERLFKHLRCLESPIVHTTASIDSTSIVGSSNLIFAFSYIGPEVNIGDNNIINTRSTLEHEVLIGDHNHISIGAVLAGRVKIGNGCFIGAGAIIKDKVKIGDNITIGAGGVVVKDILEPGVYIGNPLRRLR